MDVLPKKQHLQFETEGYLLASGLIPNHISEKAEKAMWRLMEMDPNDSETWGRRLGCAAQFQPVRGVSV